MTAYASNSLRPVAGTQYVPDSMEAKGKIKVVHQANTGVRNGDGILVLTGLEGFTWTFDALTKAELDWWADLVDGGIYGNAFSKRWTETGAMPAFRFWDLRGNPRSYKVGVIDMPAWESYGNARFRNVVVNFSSLEKSTVF